MSKQILVTAGLSNYKLGTKLAGLINNVEIEKIILVRKNPLSVSTLATTLPATDKVVNVTPNLPILRLLPFFEIWRLYTLVKIARSPKIHAIVGIQLVIHGVQARISGWLTNKPSILCVIGDDVHKHLQSPKTRYFLYPFVKFMNHVTVMGNKSLSIVKGLGVPNEKITLIQNFQNADKFKKLDCPKKWDIVFIGDLIRRKRVSDLLYAISTLKPCPTVAIVGSGKELDTLKELASSLNIEEKVFFIGQVSNVEKYLNESRIMVLPSELEALPAVAVEAMYCGTPAILTRICDIPTYFKDEQGCLLFQPGDTQTLTKHIQKLLDNESFYNTSVRHCLSWADQHAKTWSIEEQTNIWRNILAQL